MENNNNNPLPSTPLSLLPPPPQILTVQIPSYKTPINGRLPPDSLLQIWARLPIKTLYKFRSVCKFWNHKISTDPLLSSLIHTLNNNTPSTPLSLLLSLTHTQTEPVKIPDRPVHLSSKPLHVTLSQTTINPHLYPIKNGFTPYVDHTLFLLPSSHLGPIICFSTNVFFYLSNPSTHAFLKIPRGQTSLSKFSALGYLPSLNKYILARQNHDNVIEFLEFGPGFAATAEWQSTTVTCTHAARDFGVFINNTFYWRVEANDNDENDDGTIFAWGLEVEGRREKVIGRPEGNEGETILYDMIYLVEYKGSLCAVDNFSKPPRTMIWVLNENDEWVRKFNIHISGMDRDVVYPFCDDYIEGEMVLCNVTRSRLYCYCFKNKSVRQVYRPKQRSCDRVFAVYTPGLFPLEIVD